MTEDVSAYYRLAVTITLLAALVSSILVIFINSLSTANVLNQQVIAGVHSSYNAISVDIVNAKWVSAVEAYKFINSNGYAIGSLKIKYLDGTVSSDVKELMDNAHINVKVSMTKNNGVADYVLTEVER